MPIQLYDEAGTLLQKTRVLLARDKRPLLELANETGMPFYWLRKFVGGKIKNPSVNRIQFLYEKLTNKKL